MIKICIYVIDYIILVNVILLSNNNWFLVGSNFVFKVMFILFV